MAGAVWCADDVVSVVVRQTSLRADRQFFAPAVATARFRDQLTVLESGDDWFKVSHGGKTGWVHRTAITSKPAQESSGLSAFTGKSGAGQVPEDEIVLAGKGFNSSVEAEYRKKHPTSNFAAVDRMEKLAVGQNELVAFRRAGELRDRELDK